jgi:hypothetical protein
MNTTTDNKEEDLTGFTPVQRKKSRFNALMENQLDAPIKKQVDTVRDNTPITMQALGSPSVLFKRKLTNVHSEEDVLTKSNIMPVTNELPLLTKQILFVKKTVPGINISNTTLFPDLNTKVVDKPKTTTVWSSFKTRQLDINKEAPILPSIVKQAATVSAEKAESTKKVNSSSSTDGSYDSYDENNDSDEYDEEEYEETYLESLYNKHDDILDK